MAQLVKNLPAMWETWVQSLGWEDSLEKGMAASLVVQTVQASVCNAGDPGSIPGSGRSLEEEIVIHSSTLAWKILWTEEPGRLQSMGSQRVGHD